MPAPVSASASPAAPVRIYERTFDKIAAAELSARLAEKILSASTAHAVRTNAVNPAQLRAAETQLLAALDDLRAALEDVALAGEAAR